ncbi:RNA deprotection pyrophosphohydrolase [Alteribacillus iranensis]|uniref:RNA deprotection pyrophosphohydrolase n=1 Tax=Alteribacillus iranensis TaxID=930128 RepID=UPI000B82D74A|nr:nucleoside triphosphatase YtkD [Alteribacillus iranensis]
MHTFIDYYENEVNLVFDDSPFSKNPGHVWVICRYENKWLLTRHSRRGLEFPGGKVEKGETAKEAAMREVWEETGGVIANINQIGQYRVHGRSEVIVKSLFFATIDKLEKKEDYLETKGPVLLSTLPEGIQQDEDFSFIMKDDVLTRALSYIEKTGYLQ